MKHSFFAKISALNFFSAGIGKKRKVVEEIPVKKCINIIFQYSWMIKVAAKISLYHSQLKWSWIYFSVNLNGMPAELPNCQKSYCRTLDTIRLLVPKVVTCIINVLFIG